MEKGGYILAFVKSTVKLDLGRRCVAAVVVSEYPPETPMRAQAHQNSMQTLQISGGGLPQPTRVSCPQTSTSSEATVVATTQVDVRISA